ncbi:MAG: hypothetical protein ACRD38_12180 [Nitrososphaerales archaeon]
MELGSEEIEKAKLLMKREPDDLLELDYYANPEDEAVNYLRQIIKLSKRKMHSKKIDNNGKVRWARAGVEASKILLYSGVIDRAERRKTYKDQRSVKEALQAVMQRILEERNKSTVYQEQEIAC